MELIALFFGAVLINNVILAQFLGICPFLGVSKKTSSAIGMGAAVTVVILLASTITWVINKFVLTTLDIMFMDIIVYILVIASIVQLLEMLMKKFMPPLYKSMGVFLPLITTNCAVLGTVLVNITKGHDFVQMFIYSLGIPVGFTLVIFLFSSIRERLENAPIPAPFKGLPIALIVATFMAAAFSALKGMF